MRSSMHQKNVTGQNTGTTLYSRVPDTMPLDLYAGSIRLDTATVPTPIDTEVSLNCKTFAFTGEEGCVAHKPVPGRVRGHGGRHKRYTSLETRLSRISSWEQWPCRPSNYRDKWPNAVSEIA